MRILIVAGETSGDHYGTCLSRELKQLDPTTLLWRVGSEPIGLSGEELIASSQQLAVIGWMDSATRAARAAKIFTKILRVVRTHKIDAAVLIDSPAFNLKLAKALKKGGVRVFYYVSPQIWAWGQRRIKTIRKWVEHLFVLFPFEAALYAREGIAATYVGHPLFDRPFPKQSKFELRSDFFPGAVATGPGGPVFGLFPGSRESEVLRLYPRMLDSLGLIRRVYPSAKAIVAQAPSVNERTYQRIEKSYAWTSEGTTLQRVPDRVRDCIKASDIAMVASGTLTLEVACLGVPMVIVYAMHPVDFWIAKKLVQVPDIGLANIVAGKRIVPELIQDQASAQNIARATLTLIDDPIRMEGIKRDLLAIAARLGPAGASALVAKRLMEILVTGSHRREGQTISSTGRRFARSTVSLAATEFET